jgi:DNA-binding LacI/PurR family transcriptional regulator
MTSHRGPLGQRGHRAPTLEEVASRAGVGRGTASRVVNGSSQVSDSARTAVLTAIEELGYVPNRAARSLVTRLTESVALVVSESDERFFGEPFFARIVRGVSSALAETQHQLLLTIAQTPDERARLEHFLTPQHVDGVLLLSLHGDDPLPEYLESRGLPAVLGGRPAGVEPTSYVDVDNAAGAVLAVAHLVRSGRRRVATIAGPLDMSAGVGRLEGYRRALADAGLRAEPDLVAYGDFSEPSGYAATVELLDRAASSGGGQGIDAIFAASDPMAIGALRALAARGVRVPDDIAVIGFDDSPSAQYTSPLLTSVHQPVEAMGHEMVRILIARIKHEPVDLRVVLDAHLVLRESA